MDPTKSKLANRLVFIYGISDPLVGKIRYIGRSINSQARLNQHMADARRGKKTALCDWIRKLLAAGRTPEVMGIARTDEANWHCTERAFIVTYRRAGIPLLNHAIGGRGAVQERLSIEHRAAISRGLKKAYDNGTRSAVGSQNPMYGKQQTVKQKRAVMEANLGKPKSEIHRQHISEAARRRPTRRRNARGQWTS